MHQTFDGLLGYINSWDIEQQESLMIALQVQGKDLHLFYLLEGSDTIQLLHTGQKDQYPLLAGRGRFLYLPKGDYQLHIPKGQYLLFNFYFRGSLLRGAHARPYPFLNQLLSNYQSDATQSCSSVDFKAGQRSRSLIRHMLSKIKIGDLDSEERILWGINQLIKLAKEKIFDEYEKISAGEIKAKEAYALLEDYVQRKGQEFHLQEITKQLQISTDYLNQLLHTHYDRSPLELKNMFLIRRAQELLHAHWAIAQIAYELGYSSPSSFARFFKKHKGITASDYFKRE